MRRGATWNLSGVAASERPRRGRENQACGAARSVSSVWSWPEHAVANQDGAMGDGTPDADAGAGREASGRRARYGKRLEVVHDRFGLLLFLLVGSFVAAGFDGTLARVVSTALVVGALLVAIIATRMRHDNRWLALLALTAVFALLAALMSGDSRSGV